MLFNPNAESSQETLLRILALSFDLTGDALRALPRAELGERTLATFKTPTLRALGLSAPYMHTGHIDTIEQSIIFYVRAASFAHLGGMRNPDPILKTIRFRPGDLRNLKAFLESLNEDTMEP